MRNRIGEIEHCCWPGCTRGRYEEPDAPPFCAKHLIRCAMYVSAEAQHLSEGPLLPPRPPLAAPIVDGTSPAAPVVYYVRIGEHIKIGTTTNLRARLEALYVHDPNALLATEPGGRDVEHSRHYDFRDERVYANRELFHPSPRLMAHITGLKAVAA